MEFHDVIRLVDALRLRGAFDRDAWLVMRDAFEEARVKARITSNRKVAIKKFGRPRNSTLFGIDSGSYELWHSNTADVSPEGSLLTALNGMFKGVYGDWPDESDRAFAHLFMGHTYAHHGIIGRALPSVIDLGEPNW